jgi:hypothetical protein
MRKPKMFGDALGIVDIVDAATAMAFVSLRIKFRKAALIPQLHGEADDGLALLTEHGGHSGTIDTAAHGDGG